MYTKRFLSLLASLLLGTTLTSVLPAMADDDDCYGGSRWRNMFDNLSQADQDRLRELRDRQRDLQGDRRDFFNSIRGSNSGSGNWRDNWRNNDWRNTNWNGGWRGDNWSGNNWSGDNWGGNGKFQKKRKHNRRMARFGGGGSCGGGMNNGFNGGNLPPGLARNLARLQDGSFPGQGVGLRNLLGF